MVTQTLLRESVTEAPVKKGGKWRVVVARPGQGSSGNYSAEVLKRDAHKIVPAGAQCFINHDITRNPRDMVGVYEEAATWDETESAVIAELKVFSHYDSFVSEVGPHCGISLYALGDVDENGNITAFHEDKYNGADLVARPGLEGSGLVEKLSEAHKVSENKPVVESPAQEGKENKEMEKEIEELTAKVATLAASVETLVSAQTAQATEAAQTEADEKAVEAALEAYDAARKTIEDADLLPVQKEALLARAKKGEDITEALTEAKTVKEEAMKALAEDADNATGRIVGSGTDWKPGAYSGR